MKRKQFTFYYSFYDVISCIEEPSERAEAYDVLCRYALTGEKPEFEKLSLGTKMAVKAFIPTLDAARKKAQGGMKSNAKPKDVNKMPERSQEDTANKNKDKIEIKKELKKELKQDNEAAFDLFWDAYPRKVQKIQARAAFDSLDVSLEVLLKALQTQKQSDQWLEGGGRFVPYPAKWLKERLWEDTALGKGDAGGCGGYGRRGRKEVPMGCGPMGDSELQDLKQMLQG